MAIGIYWLVSLGQGIYSVFTNVPTSPPCALCRRLERDRRGWSFQLVSVELTGPDWQVKTRKRRLAAGLTLLPLGDRCGCL